MQELSVVFKSRGWIQLVHWSAWFEQFAQGYVQGWQISEATSLKNPGPQSSTHSLVFEL